MDKLISLMKGVYKIDDNIHKLSHNDMLKHLRSIDVDRIFTKEISSIGEDQIITRLGKSRMPILTFGLVPLGKRQELKLLIKQMFGEETDDLGNVATKQNLTIIVFKYISPVVIEYDINALNEIKSDGILDEDFVRKTSIMKTYITGKTWDFTARIFNKEGSNVLILETNDNANYVPLGAYGSNPVQPKTSRTDVIINFVEKGLQISDNPSSDEQIKNVFSKDISSVIDEKIVPSFVERQTSLMKTIVRALPQISDMMRSDEENAAKMAKISDILLKTILGVIAELKAKYSGFDTLLATTRAYRISSDMRKEMFKWKDLKEVTHDDINTTLTTLLTTKQVFS